MNVNRQAPVVARQSVIVSTPVDAVWRLLTDIDRWPMWKGVARHFQRPVNTALVRWLAFLKDDVEDRALFVQYVMKERDAIG